MSGEEIRKKFRRYGQPASNSQFTIIVRHPLADDLETLARIGEQPKNCTSCDIYWLYKEYLFLVSIEGGADEAFASFSKNSWVEHGESFFVQTKHTPLRSDHIEAMLEQLVRWVELNAETLAGPLDDHSVVLPWSEL